MLHFSMILFQMVLTKSLFFLFSQMAIVLDIAMQMSDFVVICDLCCAERVSTDTCI